MDSGKNNVPMKILYYAKIYGFDGIFKLIKQRWDDKHLIILMQKI